MTSAAIIVAAGRGHRAGGELPKQWQPLADQRVIDHTIAAFAQVPEITQCIVVVHPNDLHMMSLQAGLSIVTGGATRAQSVRNGLEALSATPPKHVLIHDAARCCISPDLISALLAELHNADTLAIAPALPVTDALWQGSNNIVTGVQDRSALYRAQTPQGFDYQTILDAHRIYDGSPADDIEVARAAGVTAHIFPGEEDNLKITTAADFGRAEKILRQEMDIRIGTGFDVHRFGPGDHVTLCGVKVPHDRGLQGHSDADVSMHALTDAIYGALAEGDIGQHFPPSDPQWRGADSHIFLRHAAQLADSKGYSINNLDVTLICERPKIGPHSTAMRKALADILNIGIDRISVKATTSERLGFTGREEGIAAQAAVTLVKT